MRELRQSRARFARCARERVMRNPLPRIVDLSSPFLLLLLVLTLALGACESGAGKGHTPTGTPTDPVEVCERHGLVCHFKNAQLGVCVAAQSDAAKAKCKGRFPCLICAPQH